MSAAAPGPKLTASPADPPTLPAEERAGDGRWLPAGPCSHHSVGPDALAVRPSGALLTPPSVSELADMLARTDDRHVVVDLRDVDLEPGAVDALAAVGRWLRQHRSGALTVRLNGAVQVIAFGSACRMLIG
jgi:hypothetical protein